MDDPNQSVVADKIEYAPTPHSPGLPPGPALGHWLGSVAHNVPDDRSARRWNSSAGSRPGTPSSPISRRAASPSTPRSTRNPLADERKNRWMKPLAAALPHAINPYDFPEATEVVAVLELGLNRAIAGEITSSDALNSMSDDIYKVMEKYKYKTGEGAKLGA